MERNIKGEIESMRETERMLNLRLLYLYERTDVLKKEAIQNRENKKKACQLIMKCKIMEKEIPVLEKQWFAVFEYILALEGAILWKEFYKSLKMSAEFMKKINARIERMDPSGVMSNARTIMEEYREITDSLSAWNDEQDEEELMFILSGGKDKKDLGEGDQEEEMASPPLARLREEETPSFPSVPTTSPAPASVKQLA